MTVTKTENYTEEVTVDVNVTVPLLVRNGLETLLTSKLEKSVFDQTSALSIFFLMFITLEEKGKSLSILHEHPFLPGFHLRSWSLYG